MSRRVVEDVQKKQQGEDRPLVPGWEQLCSVCVFKDFYNNFKNNSALMQELQRQNQLVQNLSRQLNLVTKELEMVRDKYEPDPEAVDAEAEE